MSSELQLDVHHLNWWRRHLVNAYEVKGRYGVYCRWTMWSMPERFKVVCIPCKALYICDMFNHSDCCSITTTVSILSVLLKNYRTLEQLVTRSS